MKSTTMISPRFLLVALAAGFFAVLALLGGLQLAFDKLGLSPEQAGWMFAAAALGSMINLPLFAIAADADAQQAKRLELPDELLRPLALPPGRMLVAINLGGCLVPLVFALLLLGQGSLAFSDLIVACVAVSFVAYGSSTLVPGVGVIMPMMIVPVAAALVGQALDAANAAPLAYVSATLGVLVGADLLRLRALGDAGESAVSIGGAGCFDGIFLAGVLAVLLS